MEQRIINDITRIFNPDRELKTVEKADLEYFNAIQQISQFAESILYPDGPQSEEIINNIISISRNKQ